MKQEQAHKPIVEVYDDVEQGAEAWFGLRRGIPTASCFSLILAAGAGRDKYRRRLAGEILSGLPAETFSNHAMQRGKDMEAEAFDYYANRHFATVRRVGFIRRRLPNGRRVGPSPVGLIGHHKGLEIKTMQPDLLIERLEGGTTMPSEHRAQVQGLMWVADLDEVDLLLFYSGMPIAPKYNIKRDQTYIKTLSNAIEVFDFELHKLVEKIKKMSP